MSDQGGLFPENGQPRCPIHHCLLPCMHCKTGDAQREPHFSGPEYVPSLDFTRLKGQLLRIASTMSGGVWKSLGEIASLTGDPEASISAQLRHLRKERFGSHVVDKRRRGARASGLWEYRLREGPLK